jgi:hypothetical protein
VAHTFPYEICIFEFCSSILFRNIQKSNIALCKWYSTQDSKLLIYSKTQFVWSINQNDISRFIIHVDFREIWLIFEANGFSVANLMTISASCHSIVIVRWVGITLIVQSLWRPSNVIMFRQSEECNISLC